MTTHDDASNALATIEQTKKYAAKLATFSMETTNSVRTTKVLLVALLEDAACQLHDLGFYLADSDTRFNGVPQMIDASLEDWTQGGMEALQEELTDYFHRVKMNAEQALPSRFEEMQEHSTQWGL